MVAKRSSVDADLHPVHTRPSNAKRNRLSPSAVPMKDHVDASAPLTPYSDLPQSSSTRAVSTQHTEPPSRNSNNESPSKETSAADTEADARLGQELQTEHIISLPASERVLKATDKPDIDPDVLMAYAKELESKLHAFLPKLRHANSQLTELASELNMENVDESGRHIELNLNLGVLEQKQPGSELGTGDIQLPRKEASSGPTSPLAATMTVASLLNGNSDQKQPGIEVLDSADIATELPGVVSN